MESGKKSVRQKRSLSPGDDNDDQHAAKKGRTPTDEMADGTLAAASGEASGPNIPSIEEITDDAIKSAPRRFAITLLGNWRVNGATKREIADYVENSKPDGCQIREVIFTAAEKVLIFPATSKDFNILLKEDKWKAGCKITPVIAPRARSKTAVIIHDVDKSFTETIILEELRRRGYRPSAAKRMKRASDGEETGSVKIFLEEEAQIDRAIKDGIFIKMFFHPAKRYIASRFTQCRKCQSLDGHQSNNCRRERKCMKCAEPHHHSDCLKTPDQYKCSNCNGPHTSNDNRCPKVKEAKELAPDAAAGAGRQQSAPTTSTSSSASSPNIASFPPLPPNHSAWTPPTAATTSSSTAAAPPPPHGGGGYGLDKDQLTAAIKVAVKEAVTDAFQNCSQNFFQEASKTFAQEMAKSAADIRDATTALAAIMQRYAEDMEEDDDFSQEMSFESNINSRDCTSTPLPTGREKDVGSQTQQAQAARRPAPTAPSLVEDQSTFMISLPPTMIKIKKGKDEKEVAKIISEETNSRVKLMRKDLKLMQQQIISKNLLLPPTLNLASNSTASDDATKYDSCVEASTLSSTSASTSSTPHPPSISQGPFTAPHPPAEEVLKKKRGRKPKRAIDGVTPRSRSASTGRETTKLKHLAVQTQNG